MIALIGVWCCLSAAVLSLLGQESERETDELKSVTKVDHLKDLEILFETEPKALQLVAISGKVGSEAPIKCGNLRAVIVKETAEQHFLKQTEEGLWEQDSKFLFSRMKEVPWYLDDGTARVHVLGAKSASKIIALTVASEVFEESGRSLVCETLDYIKRLKMLGVKRTERVLPTGTSLTVVGEAAKDDTGTIRIQKPNEGPFYVTQKNIDDLIAEHGTSTRWFEFASIGLMGYGVSLLVVHAIQCIGKEDSGKDL